MPDSFGSNAGSGLRIVMMPDYRSTNPYQGLIAEELERLGARVNFGRGRRRVFPLRAAAREFDVDVVHLHWITPFLHDGSTWRYAMFAGRLLLDIALTRMRGTRVVWTIHNKVSHETRHPRFEMWVSRRISRHVDAMIVHSPEIRREIAAALGKPLANFDIIPHASFGEIYGDPPDIREAREALALDRAGRVFLNFGLMRPYKGLKRLLEAWKTSGLGAAGHTLLLAGQFNDPVYRDEIVSSAAPIAGVRIDAGFVPDERVRFYLGACDAVVLPFERILTSSTMHLAITFGKPIVAPRVGSVGEMLRDAGRFAYDDTDPNGLRHALSECAVADLAEERREVERLRSTLLDWNGVARATLAVYERVCSSRAKGRRWNRRRAAAN